MLKITCTVHNLPTVPDWMKGDHASTQAICGGVDCTNFLPISILYSQLIYRNLREVTPHARTGIAQRVNLYDQWLVLSPRLLVSRPGEATQQLNAKSQNITVTSTICV